MKNKYFLLLICCFCFSCKHEKSDKTKLYGIDVDGVSVISSSPFGNNQFYPEDRNSYYPTDNGAIEINFNITSPQVKLITILNSFYRNIYITPGDSVSFEIKSVGERKILKFSGNNAAHYNFFYELDNILDEQESLKPKYYEISDLNEYKQSLLNWRNIKMAFLERYKKDNTISMDFYNYARNSIMNEYIYYVYQPFLHNQAIDPEVPENYFDTEEPENDMANMYYHAMSAKYYLLRDNLYNDFNAIYNEILNDYDGEKRAYLLSTLIGIFALKQQDNYSDSLLDAIKDAPKYVNNPVYLDYINKAEVFYTQLNKPFPDNVLDNTFLRSYESEDRISLREVLDKYKGKGIYLDFWASWCGPCRQDIASSSETKRYLKEKDIEVIYISKDTKEQLWKEASEKDGIIQNQYLLFDQSNSPLTQYLKINSIPHYVILDKEHKLRNTIAPRLNPESFEKVKELIIQYFPLQVMYF